MTRKRQKTETSSPRIPAYIVTFSDMVTLLLTFFVMLLSLAKVQDPELFNVGRDSFVKSIRSCGLGMFSGKMIRPYFGGTKIKYMISEPDKLPEVRTIDAREENVRRIFKKITRSMTTLPSQIVAQKTNFSVANIRFSRGDATLNEPAKKFLTQFALDLQQNVGPREVKLYVLGLAGDETTEKQRWILSAKRAQAVSDCLNQILPSQLQWSVYSWGAGSGGNWVDRDSPISKQSQILIGVLRAND